MSCSTWLSEFYPIPASKAIGSELEALDHCILKWRGALPPNLKRHRVTLRRVSGGLAPKIIGKDGGHGLFFSTRTCALCLVSGELRVCCSCCPAVGCLLAYRTFCDTGDPRPMLDHLRKARRQLVRRLAKEKP